MAEQRAHWGSRLAFVLAAAGSAVGLGNIWRFPYVAGENGGGLFVLTYFACIALVALPIMMAEIFIGRTAQSSPVGAFRTLSARGSPWVGVGALGVITAFVILSFYSVVAGWAMHYTWISLTESFVGKDPSEISEMFNAVRANPEVNTLWHVIFMVLSVSIVVAGIQEGIEAWVRVLMPALFVILLILLGYAMTTEGFGEGFWFVFSIETEGYTGESVLAALGQGFFTLSLGMGAMITYGSYLRSHDDIVSTSVMVAVLDTTVAILGALVVFPLIFAAGLDPQAGPGLVFRAIPVAFSKMPGGLLLAPAFFILLTVGALTSSISLLEVATSYFIDQWGWPRSNAAVLTGILIVVLGVPSALSGNSRIFGEGMKNVTEPLLGTGMNWLTLFDKLSANWMLPLGGLGIAMFVAWRVGGEAREAGFKAGSRWGKLYWAWVQLLRYLVPIGVLAVFLHAVGVFHAIGLL